MPYEVQQHTETHGWVNNWLYDEGDGVLRPETFETREAAKAALNEYLLDIEEESQAGHIGSGIPRLFCIAHVPNTAPQPDHQQGARP